MSAIPLTRRLRRILHAISTEILKAQHQGQQRFGSAHFCIAHILVSFSFHLTFMRQPLGQDVSASFRQEATSPVYNVAHDETEGQGRLGR